MRIEANDLSIELVIKSPDGTELGTTTVPATELISHFIKSDAEAAAATDQKREPAYNRVMAFKEWLTSLGMSGEIHDELYGVLYVKTYNSIDAIQKKMLETEPGKPS